MNKRLLLFAAVTVLGVTVYSLGVYEFAKPAILQDWLLGLGPWGPVLFVGVYALSQLLLFPYAVFLLAAGLTWSPLTAVLTTWIGGMLAGFPSFLFSRYIARRWVHAHLPDKFRRFDDGLQTRGVRTVTMVRLLFFHSVFVPPALGLSEVRAGQFAVGTLIGTLPGVFLFVYLGPTAVQWLFSLPPVLWGSAVALLAGAGLLYLVARRRRRAATADETPPAVPQPEEA